MRKNKLISGFSLLELIVAIAIAGIVMTLAFTVFTDAVKGFRFQSSHAENIRKMLITKKRIDKLFSNISSVESWTEYSMKYKKDESDSVFTIRFSNEKLFSDNSLICENMKSFKFDLKDDKSGNKQLFFWEAVLNKGNWIGGALLWGNDSTTARQATTARQHECTNARMHECTNARMQEGKRARGQEGKKGKIKR